MRKRSLLWLILLAVFALLAAACPQQQPRTTQSPTPEPERTFAADSYMAVLKTKGKVVIGVKFDIPQFGLLNPATSKPEGFEIDLGNLIAEELGVPAEFVEAISANRIPFLLEDKVDLILSNMTINEERKQQIDFSIVYYIARQRLLVAKDSNIKNVDDLNAQTRVCSAQGSTSERNVRVAAPTAPLELRRLYSECFGLLQNNQVQAVSTDDVILLGFAKQEPERFGLVGDPFSSEPYGAGIKKGRVGFVDFVNDVIGDAKKDGTWLRYYNKWVRPISGEAGKPPPDEAAASAPSPSPAASPTG
jgi:ABC-type amino acid transport substrate-binding protein